MDLKLTLKKKWYDMIFSGEKPEDYREKKDYWNRLIVNNYETVTFYLGYQKNRPEMHFEIESITEGCGKPEWGAEEGKTYYIIKLGNRIKN